MNESKKGLHDAGWGDVHGTGVVVAFGDVVVDAVVVIVVIP